MQESPYKNDCVIFNSVNGPVNSTYKANVLNKFLIFLTNFSVNVYVAIDISMNSNTIVCGKVPAGKYLYHTEISQLIYSADQSGGSCIVRGFEKSDFQTTYHVTVNTLKCQLLLSLSKFPRQRHTQSLLRFCLIRFPLLNQQKLF